MPSAHNGQPAISLIIAVYERSDALELVLASLADQTFQDFEVIVADDGSGQSIRRIVAASANTFDIVHAWHDNDGFRKTIIVNRAVTMARADYIVFLDGDCLLHRRFLERHWCRRAARQALSGRRVMFDEALSGRVTLEDVRRRRIERPGYWWAHAGKIDRWHGLYMPYLWHLRRRRDRYQILGSNFSLHKNDFYMVNGYDERIIGRGLEDNNLWARLVNSGIAIRTVTQEALQYHLHHNPDPIPHSADIIDTFRDTRETRTPYGIVKE